MSAPAKQALHDVVTRLAAAEAEAAATADKLHRLGLAMEEIAMRASDIGALFSRCWPDDVAEANGHPFFSSIERLVASIGLIADHGCQTFGDGCTMKGGVDAWLVSGIPS